MNSPSSISINSKNLGSDIMQHIYYLEKIHYKILRLLGLGSEGNVFLARNKNSKRLVAIKLSFTTDNGEYLYWLQIKHKNCLQLYDKFTRANICYYVMEFAENLTMMDWIQDTWHNESNALPNEELMKLWSVQLTDALRYLHQRELFHLDIKPDNIFLDSKWNVKLGDFGYLRSAKENSAIELGCPLYRPPEGLVCWIPSNVNLEKIDVWSLGCLLLEMISGKLISATRFKTLEMSFETCVKNIRHNFPKLEDLEIPFGGGLDLVRLLLQLNPNDRPSISELSSHPWLHVNWSLLKKPSSPDLNSFGSWLHPLLKNKAIAKAQQLGNAIVDYFHNTRTPQIQEEMEVELQLINDQEGRTIDGT